MRWNLLNLSVLAQVPRLINHGIDECIMNDVMDASKRLFDLDLESKLALTGRDDDNNNDNGAEKKGYRGYFGIGSVGIGPPNTLNDGTKAGPVWLADRASPFSSII